MSEAVFLSAGYVASLAGLLTALGVWVFFIVGARSGMSGRAALVASTLTVAWLATLWSAFATPSLFGLLREAATVLEVLTYAGWFGVLLRVLGVGPRHVRASEDRAKSQYFWTTLAITVLGVITAFVHMGLTLLRPEFAGPLTAGDLGLNIARLLLAVTGLVLIEQVVRHTRRDSYWNIKYLVLGLAVVYGFAFVMYADAVLFQRQAPALLAAQGIIFAVASPFLVLGTVRNRTQRLNVNLSRRLVFRTGVLMLTGIYLLLVGSGGFWLQVFGGSWGDFLAVLFVLIALTSGIGLAASSSLRERLALWLRRNLYQRKHDYGERWLRVTETLLAEEDDATLGERAVRALKEIVQAHQGALWRIGDSGVLLPVAQLHCSWNTPFSGAESAVIRDVFETHQGPLLLDGDADAISLREQRVVAVLSEVSGAHVAVPLCLPDRLYGVVLLSAPVTGDSIEWEDEELLGLAARQIASFLAHNDAQSALGVSRQLDSFNQMTAFVVHDLKTVVAQLSLMGRNAEKHRDNPGFVDDMIRTSAHAADRIQTLLQHLKQQRERVKAHVANLSLCEIVEQVVAGQQDRPPRPELIEEVAGLQVRANADQLVTVLGHLVQNAQQVCATDGRIVLRLLREGDWNAIRVEDDGPGMDAEFIANRLFRPFESTKGLAGMGVGTWQAREYVRSIGGDIRVESAPGKGAVFSVLVPPSASESDTDPTEPIDRHEIAPARN